MEFFYVVKASKKSGKPSAVFWFTSKTEALAKLQAQVILGNAEIETGRGQDYNNPVRTDFPVVDDLPAEGEVDFTWCDHYELQDDGRTWLPVKAQPEEAEEPTEDNSDTDEPTTSKIVDSLDPLAPMTFRTQLLAQFLSTDNHIFHINKEQKSTISAMEMDQDDIYVQNLLLAAGNYPEIKQYSLPDIWKLTNAIRKVWPTDKAPALDLLLRFMKAWVSAHPIDRGLLAKEWAAGKRIDSVQRTDNKTNAGSGITTDRNPDVTHTLDILDLEIACALLPMDFNIHEIPGGILRRAREIISDKDSPFKEWSKLLRGTAGILDVNRTAIFNLIRLAPDHIYLTPATHQAYVSSTLTTEFSQATELVAPENKTAEQQPEIKKVSAGVFSIDGLEEKPKKKTYEELRDDLHQARANIKPKNIPVPETINDVQMEKTESDKIEAGDPVSEGESANDADPQADAVNATDILATGCPGLSDAVNADVNQISEEPDQNIDIQRQPEPVSEEIEPESQSDEPAPEYPAYFEPGRYENIPNEVYHAANGISSTQVKDARVSLMYFHGRHIAKTIKRDSSDALTFGSLVHTLALEPEKFSEEYAVFPGIPDNSFTTTDSLKAFIREYNADKPKAEQLKLTGKKEDLQEAIRSVSPDAIFADEFEQQWRDSVTEKTILTAEQVAAAMTIQQALFSHPTAGKLLQHPSRSVESSYFGMDEETGLEVRVRPDLELSLEDVRIGVDLKTINMGKVKQDALRARLHREIIDRDYHVSAGMYCNVADFDQFFWIFVNKDDGHHWVAVIEASEELLDLGLLEYQKAMRSIASAMDTGIWPAPITDDYTDELNDFDLRRLEALRLA